MFKFMQEVRVVKALQGSSDFFIGSEGIVIGEHFFDDKQHYRVSFKIHSDTITLYFKEDELEAI